jgi:hypothetical protein
MIEYLVIAVVLVTEAAVVALHTTWVSPWWRRPFLWSDRWHILSFLSHWPAVALLAVYFLPAWYWPILAIVSAAIWAGTKRAAGKDWPAWPIQAIRWVRGQP